MQLAKTMAALERLRAAGVPVHQRPVRPDDRRRVRLVRGGRRRQRRRARTRSSASPGRASPRARSPRSCRPASSARSSCSSHGFIDRVVAAARPARRADRPAPRSCRSAVADPAASARAIDTDAAGFRPLSFLSSLAERVAERTAGDGAATEAPAGRAADRGDPARRRLGARPARPQPAPAADARVRRRDDRRLRRAPRRPPVRRRRGDGRRARPARRPARRRRRPAEGRRHRREHPAQLRDAPSGGLPQGDAGHGAGRARSACRSSPSSTSRAPIPGPESEERGIAEAIARSIGLMSRLRTPIVTVITGEGGSGGALAIAVGDVVIALENAVYSVISPEGCASILWRTADEAPAAALAMKMTAADQQTLGVVDIVVPGARRGRPHRSGRDRARGSGRSSWTGWPRSTASPSTSCSTRATAATGPSGPTLRPRCRNSHRPSSGASRIACATCSTRDGAPSGSAVPSWSRDEPPAREEV